MTSLYHGIPEDMEGHELIPLNQIHRADPILYDKYLEKYKGREEILERRIPLLNCLWNDVVQLLPLHPRKLFELQHQLGLIENIPNYNYFEVESSLLDPARTVIYFKSAPGEEDVTVKWLNDVDLNDLQEIPLATVDYYKSMVGKNEPVFNYQFVPHVIYMGTIDVLGSPLINLRALN